MNAASESGRIKWQSPRKIILLRFRYSTSYLHFFDFIEGQGKSNSRKDVEEIVDE